MTETYPILLESGSNNWLFEDGQTILWKHSGDFAWALMIDWENNDSFGNEANRVISVHVNRGRDYKFKSDGRGWEYPRIGRAVFGLDNSDRRYDPYNTNSPLYGNILPGRRIRLIAEDLSAETNYNVFYGFIEDIRPTSGGDYVHIKCIDDLALFRDFDYEANLYTDEDLDDLMLRILTDTDWVADGKDYSIDSSPSDVVNYWWCSNKSALKAIEELCDSVMGNFFISNNGTFKFFNRHHEYADGITIDQTQLSKTIQVLQPWEVVKNYIRVRSYPRTTSSSIETLWVLEDIPQISSGDTIDFWAESFYDGEVVPAAYVTLTKTTDYTANAAADGGGADMTDDLGVTDTQFATTRKISIKNNHGSDIAHITLLQSRGYPITSRPTTIIEENLTSQGVYGKKKFILDNVWIQNSNTANDLASTLKGSLASPEAYAQVIIENRPDIQFGIDLFDMETLDIDELEISGEYLVEHIEHNWRAGRGVRSTIRFAPSSSYSGAYWTFPAEIGVETVFGF